jgi:penicillin amidase
LVVTANQNPFPPDYPYAVNGNFASHYRSRRIRELLLARNGWQAQDMLSVQKDVYSSFLQYLAQAIVEAYGRHQPQHAELHGAVEVLRGWNGQMDKDGAAPLIATLAYEHLKLLVAQSASPAIGARYKYQMAPAVIETLLRTRPAGWFNDWDEAILRALAQGLDDGRRSQGRDPSHWIYGKYQPLLLANPVGRHLPLVAGLFDIGPVAMNGSPTTVKQYDGTLGPSMRLDADLADWDHSLLQGTTGQSGQVLSRHYKDQWEHYYAAQSFPMQYRKVEAKDVLTLAP